MKRLVLIWLVVCASIWAQPVLADDVTVSVIETECFVRSERDGIFRLWLRTPNCHFTINNPTADTATVNLRLANLDPDVVMINNDIDPAITIDRREHRVRLTVTLSPGSKEIVVAPWYEYDDDWYFVALSDNQALGTIESNPVFTELINHINVVNPPFFTNSGDLISSSASTADVEEAYQAVADALSYSNVPMYAVPGNHDQITLSDDYIQEFGEGDYSFDYADTRFVGFSTGGDTPRGTVSSEQLTWLVTTLADSPTHQVALFHHAVTPPTWAKSTCCYEVDSVRDALASTLEGLGIDLAINGHSQGFDLNTTDQSFTQLITGGAGGQIAQPDGYHHFSLVHVTADGIEAIEHLKNNVKTGVDYFNNTGKSTQASAYLVNSGTVDLPSVRLKFKIKPNHSTVVVADDAGSIINTVHQQNLADYAVVYVDSSAPPDSAVTTTVNAFDYTTTIGTVDVQPSLWETTGTHQRRWTETVSDSTVSTDYKLYNLPIRRLFTLMVNNSVVGTALTTADGELEFSVHDDSLTREVYLQMRPQILPRTILTSATVSGQTTVRSLSASGIERASWLVSEPIQRLTWLALDPTQAPYVLATHSNANATTASLYTAKGRAIADEPLPVITNADQLELAVGDINGDDQQELLSWSDTQHRQLTLRQFDYATSVFTSLGEITLPRSTRAVKTVLGDFTADGIGDIVVVLKRAHHTELRLYSYQAGIITLVDKQRLTGMGNYFAVTLGYVTQASQPEILISSRRRLSIYNQTRSGLELFKRITWHKVMHGPMELLAVPVAASGLDTIVLASSADSRALLYDDGERNTIYPFGRSYHGGLTVSYLLNETTDQFASIVFGQPTSDQIVLY